MIHRYQDKAFAIWKPFECIPNRCNQATKMPSLGGLDSSDKSQPTTFMTKKPNRHGDDRLGETRLRLREKEGKKRNTLCAIAIGAGPELIRPQKRGTMAERSASRSHTYSLVFEDDRGSEERRRRKMNRSTKKEERDSHESFVLVEELRYFIVRAWREAPLLAFGRSGELRPLRR